MKPIGNKKKNNYKKPYQKREEKNTGVMSLEDIEKWIKKHQNIEYPSRSKANSLGEKKKNKRRK